MNSQDNSKQQAQHDAQRDCSRRSFLATTAAAGIAPLVARHGLAAPFSPVSPTAPGKFVVFINLVGGNDAINTLVPTGLSKYAERRGSLALTTAQTMSLGSGPGATNAFRLHPAMPRTAALWTEGSVAAVGRVGYPRANLSHFISQDIWSTGMRGFSARSGGWMARFADENGLGSLDTISVGMGRPLDFLGGSTEPLLVRSLGAFRFEVDNRYRNHHEHRLNRIRALLTRQKSGLGESARRAIEQGHGLASQLQAAYSGYTGTASYPTSSPGSRLKDIARLLQAGFSTRLFYTGFGGFDTHGAQGTTSGRQATLLDRLDAAIGAFADDMKAFGRWNDCALVVYSEFGRRNFINGSGGTDHGGAGLALVLGGNVRGGYYGPLLTNADLEERYLDYAVDFRQVFAEVLERHLGGQGLARVFPEELEKTITLGLL